LVLMVILTVFATVADTHFYIELPLILLATFVWVRIRRWLGVERLVREAALRRRQEDPGR
jgi:hypothetical protein